MIFTQRRLDPGVPLHYRDFENSPRFHRVYLDEIPEDVANRSLELGIVQLIGVKQEVAPERAKQLIARAKQEVTDATAQKKILELVETVIVYKFPDLSSQEIAAMLGLSELKQTRVYQEALKEGRREGKQEEALAFVIRLLARRFGAIAPDLQAQIQQLSSSQLEELGEALLDFSTTQDLVTWLVTHQ